ncbi:MAG: CsbD family protein [Janthinobacterium lividum]
MKALPWIIAGVAFGAVAYYIANAPEPQFADRDVEDAANQSNLWGGKQRVKGTGGDLLGKAKEGFGRATGNDSLAAEGVGDQIVGNVKDAAGKVAGAVGDTLHDLNRS